MDTQESLGSADMVTRNDMMSIKIALLALLLTAAAEASAGSPDCDEVVADNHSDLPGSNRYSGVIATSTTEIGSLLAEYFESDCRSGGYSLVGQADDGSYVLHTVDRGGRFVALHELLLLRPVSEASALHEDKHHAGILRNGRYVIEKLETIRIDDPYDASVKVEGNEIVVTITSP